MLKTKLFGLAIAIMMGFVGISPVNVIAAEVNSEAVIMSEDNQVQKDNKTSFNDVMQKAEEKWNTLTNKQKAEVYSLLKNELKAEIRLLDKLVNLGVFEKADAEFIKTRMQEKLDELNKTGEFPLARPKRNNKQ